METTSTESAPKPLAWYNAWGLALLPFSIPHDTVANAPNASVVRALIWLMGASFAGAVAYWLVVTYPYPYGLIVDVLRPAFIIMLAVPAAIAVIAGLNHWIAKAFGGKGSFVRLFYAMAAVVAPLTLVYWVVQTVSFAAVVMGPPDTARISLSFGLAPCLLFGIVAYQFVLCVFAIRAAHQLTTGRAAASAIVTAVIVIVATLPITIWLVNVLSIL